MLSMAIQDEICAWQTPLLQTKQILSALFAWPAAVGKPWQTAKGAACTSQKQAVFLGADKTSYAGCKAWSGMYA